MIETIHGDGWRVLPRLHKKGQRPSYNEMLALLGPDAANDEAAEVQTELFPAS